MCSLESLEPLTFAENISRRSVKMVESIIHHPMIIRRRTEMESEEQRESEFDYVYYHWIAWDASGIDKWELKLILPSRSNVEWLRNPEKRRREANDEVNCVFVCISMLRWVNDFNRSVSSCNCRCKLMGNLIFDASRQSTMDGCMELEHFAIVHITANGNGEMEKHFNVLPRLLWSHFQCKHAQVNRVFKWALFRHARSGLMRECVCVCVRRTTQVHTSFQSISPVIWIEIEFAALEILFFWPPQMRRQCLLSCQCESWYDYCENVHVQHMVFRRTEELLGSCDCLHCYIIQHAQTCSFVHSPDSRFRFDDVPFCDECCCCCCCWYLLVGLITW